MLFRQGPLQLCALGCLFGHHPLMRRLRLLQGRRESISLGFRVLQLSPEVLQVRSAVSQQPPELFEGQALRFDLFNMLGRRLGSIGFACL